MTRPMIRVHDTSIDEITDREMNDAEFAVYEQSQADSLEADQAATDKAAAQTALLAKLGITADEAKLLLS